MPATRCLGIDLAPRAGAAPAPANCRGAAVPPRGHRRRRAHGHGRPRIARVNDSRGRQGRRGGGGGGGAGAGSPAGTPATAGACAWTIHLAGHAYAKDVHAYAKDVHDHVLTVRSDFFLLSVTRIFFPGGRPSLVRSILSRRSKISGGSQSQSPRRSYYGGFACPHVLPTARSGSPFGRTFTNDAADDTHGAHASS
jgi:hypothetical protein